MAKYDPYGPRYMIYPTTDPKLFMLWQHAGDKANSSYEVTGGTLRQVTDYIKAHPLPEPVFPSPHIPDGVPAQWSKP